MQNTIQNIMHNTEVFCNTIYNIKNIMVCDMMAKFRVPRIPTSTNKSIRFPDDMIAKIEDAIVGTGCTFSAFVVEAVRVALADLEEQKENERAD